jgi:hypothetical protein
MPSREVEMLRADVRYRREQIALLRAKMYRWGEGSSPQLPELERCLARAEGRLRDHLRREPGT